MSKEELNYVKVNGFVDLVINLENKTNFFYFGFFKLDMKILVIDDNKENTSRLSKFFEEKGFSIIISNDPMVGLQNIQQEKFDVILLNVSTPVVSGIGVIELLASDNILKDQNILIFSEEDIPNIQLKNLLRRDGVNGFLKKPIDLDQLLTIINI